MNGWYWAAMGILALQIVKFVYSIDRLQHYHEGSFREWHHFYYGVPLVAQPWLWWLWPVGLLFAVDDAEQHARQIHEPSYQSPLHRVYAWVYRRLPRWLRHRLP